MDQVRIDDVRWVDREDGYIWGWRRVVDSVFPCGEGVDFIADEVYLSPLAELHEFDEYRLWIAATKRVVRVTEDDRAYAFPRSPFVLYEGFFILGDSLQTEGIQVAKLDRDDHGLRTERDVCDESAVVWSPEQHALTRLGEGPTELFDSRR